MSLLQIDMLNQLVNNTKRLIESGYYQNNLEVADDKRTKLPAFTELFSKGFTILGEIKPGSPTQGRMYSNRKLKKKINDIAKSADGISVLTEPNFFHGSLDNLQRVGQSSKFKKPILMKDFILDPIQFKNRNISAILLIDKILDDNKKTELIHEAQSLNIETILEVDNEKDFVNNLDTEANILAVNNRNLNSMKIDTQKSQRLVKEYKPKRPILGLSGYSSIEQVVSAYQDGVKGVLLGTILSIQKNPAKFLTVLKERID